MTSPITSLAEALIAANDALLGFFEIGEVSSSSLDADEVVPRVLERMVALVHADALVLEASDTTYQVGPDHLRPRLDDPLRWRRTHHGPFHTTVVQARHGSGLSGQIRAGRYGEAFGTGDRKILAAGLRLALGAIEIGRLHIETVQSLLEAREREHAAQIAQLALPVRHPEVDGLDIHFENRQVLGTGGDFVCFHSDGSMLSFAVGDVAGKGLPASVLMATAASATNAALRDPSLPGPGDRLRQVNEWIFDHLAAAELFLTLFTVEIRSGDGSVRWANAGHHPCLIAGPDRHLELAATTPPLGVIRPISAASQSTVLHEDEVLFVGSDGIVEQTDRTHGMFGDDRLAQAVGRGPSARSTARHLRADLASFADGTTQTDDQTMVVVRRTVTP